MAVTAKSIADALDVVVEGVTCKTIPLKKDDGAPRSLQKLVESKLRVVIYIMPAQETREIAVLWKQQAYKDRWVWITDNKILRIDVDSDTPKVRLPAPRVILPGWRNLPPHVCLETRRVVRVTGSRSKKSAPWVAIPISTRSRHARSPPI